MTPAACSKYYRPGYRPDRPEPDPCPDDLDGFRDTTDCETFDESRYRYAPIRSSAHGECPECGGPLFAGKCLSTTLHSR